MEGFNLFVIHDLDYLALFFNCMYSEFRDFYRFRKESWLISFTANSSCKGVKSLTYVQTSVEKNDKTPPYSYFKQLRNVTSPVYLLLPCMHWYDAKFTGKKYQGYSVFKIQILDFILLMHLRKGNSLRYLSSEHHLNFWETICMALNKR